MAGTGAASKLTPLKPSPVKQRRAIFQHNQPTPNARASGKLKRKEGHCRSGVVPARGCGSAEGARGEELRPGRPPLPTGITANGAAAGHRYNGVNGGDSLVSPTKREQTGDQPT